MKTAPTQATIHEPRGKSKSIFLTVLFMAGFGGLLLTVFLAVILFAYSHYGGNFGLFGTSAETDTSYYPPVWLGPMELIVFLIIIAVTIVAGRSFYKFLRR